ncbi:MAG TPA: hypothetical protein VGM02_14455 [Acidobacteriaceae bacterium]|jgi:hypothetical protein
MEGALSILERLVLISISISAFYQCFRIEDSGRLGRPALGWTVRAGLIAIAAVCLFTVVRLAGTR